MPWSNWETQTIFTHFDQDLRWDTTQYRKEGSLLTADYLEETVREYLDILPLYDDYKAMAVEVYTDLLQPFLAKVNWQELADYYVARYLDEEIADEDFYPY